MFVIWLDEILSFDLVRQKFFLIRFVTYENFIQIVRRKYVRYEYSDAGRWKKLGVQLVKDGWAESTTLHFINY